LEAQQLELINPVRLPKKGSQCYELLMALQAGQRLTTMDAYEKFRITTISQRMGELRRKYGWPIKSRDLEVGPRTVVSEYWL
jgi:hypothetical protein